MGEGNKAQHRADTVTIGPFLSKKSKAMSDFRSPFSSSISSFGNGPSRIDEKRMNVGQKAAEKKARLSDQELDVFATAATNDNDLGQSAQVQEMLTGNLTELGQLYGDDYAHQAARLRERMLRVEKDRTAYRTNGEMARDAALDIASGAGTGALGIAAFGTGLVNPELGASFSRMSQALGQSLTEAQSPELQRKKELGAIRGQLNSEDINRDYEQNKADGMKNPGLVRFFDEAVSAGSDLAQNPALAGSISAQGAGSLVTSVGLTKLVTAGAEKAAKRMLAERVTPASIAALEGGGAYTEVMNEIQGMSEEELLENSPEYRALREEGRTHEGARTEVARMAANQAGLLQGAAGALTGKLVAKVEANPLGFFEGNTKSITSALSKFGKAVMAEKVEETAQGLSSGVITGSAIRQYADESRDVTEGLGRDAVESAVAGTAMAAGLRSPALAADTAEAVVATAGRALDARSEAVEAAKEADSPSSPSAVQEAAAAADQAAVEVESAVARGETPAEPSVQDEAPTAVDPMTHLRTGIQMTGPEMAEAPQAVRDLFPADDDIFNPETVAGRLDVLVAVEGFLKENKDKVNQDEVALWLADQASQLEALASLDAAAFPESVQNQIGEIVDAAKTVSSSKLVTDALSRAETVSSEQIELPPLNDQTVETPEAREAVRNQVLIARSNPAGVNPEFVGQILEQARKGRLNISEKVLKRLEVSKIAAEAAVTADQEKAALEAQIATIPVPKGEKPAKKTREMVRNEILKTGKNQDKKQLSLSQYLSQVVNAIEQGDVDRAQATFESLGNFGQSMQNKLGAARESWRLQRADNNRIKYDHWNGSSWVPANHSKAEGVYINPFSPNSMQTGFEISIDAKSVTDLYNSLLRIYGDTLTGSALPDVAVMREPKAAQPAPEVASAPEQKAEAAPEAKAGAVEPDSISETSQESNNEEVRAEEEAPAETPVVAEARDEPSPQAPAEEDGEAADQDTDRGDTDQDGEPAESADGTEPAGEADTVGRDDGAVAEPDQRVEPKKEDETEAESTPVVDLSGVPEQARTRLEGAYTFDADRSQLLTNPEPLGATVTMLKDHSGDLDLDYAVDPEKATKLADLIDTHGRAMIASMNKRLNEKHKGIRGGRLTALEALDPEKLYATASEKQKADGKNQTDVTGWANGKALALVDVYKGTYHKQLIEIATLAALHWTMNQSSTGNLDSEEVAKIMGVAETEVTAEMLFAANNGLTVDTARQSLANTILQFWGAKKNKSAPINDTKGIAEALAAEILLSMEGRLTTKFVLEKAVPIKETDEEGKTQLRKVFNVQMSHESTAETVKDLGNVRGMLQDVFLPDADKPFYINEIPGRKVDEETGEVSFKQVRNQKGNPIGIVSKKINDAVQKHRETAFHLNEPFLDLMSALGKDAYTQLLGRKDIDEEKTHKKDRESKAGKNTNLGKAWDKTFEHVERVRHVAERDGMKPSEVASYFDVFVGTNGRLMYKGFNGQNDKTMREAVVSTTATLDMTTDEGKAAFWLSVAQSTGLVKTELEYRADSIEKARKDVAKEYGKSINILRNWLKSGGEIFDEEKAVIQAEFDAGGENSAKLLHSLLGVARYMEARERGGEALTKFQHNLALEADGKTDGPLNAMMHFLVGEFSVQQIQSLRKGGFYPNALDTTLNAHFKGDDGGDLYQSSASRLAEIMRAMSTRFKGGKVEGHMEALLRMNTHFGDVKYDAKAGTIEIGRKVLKNPLTITVYGSGEDGIAAKVAAGMTDVIYALISESLQAGESNWIRYITVNKGYPEFAADAEKLFTGKAVLGTKKGDLIIKTLGSEANRRSVKLVANNDPVKFSFSRDNMIMFKENVKALMVKPMTHAIDETIGGVKKVTKLVEAATQIRSTLFQEHFKNAVEERISELVKKGELKEGDFLPEEVYAQIYKDLSKFGAVVESITGPAADAHHANLSVNENQKSDHEFGAGLGREYRGRTSLPTPSDASVSASPLVTISRGDARMMVNYYASQNPELRTLQVYDGLEIAPDLIDQVSEQINKASAEAWFDNNPVKDAAQSFRDFLRQGKDGPMGVSLSEESNAKIDRVMVSLADAGLISEGMSLQEAAEILADHLDQLAVQSEARKNALQRMGYTADHMASGERPYVHEGEYFPVLTDEELIVEMNRLYAEELAKLTDKVEPDTVIAKPDPAFEKIVKRFTEDGDKPRMSMRKLRVMMEDVSLSKDEKSVWNALSEGLSDYTIIFGDPSIQYGQTNTGTKEIHVTNMAPETLLHELLHAQTVDLTTRYYEDADSLSEAQRAAVGNLDRLMDQFEGMNANHEESSVLRETVQEVQGQIRDAIESGDRNAALQEFIAWSTTNKNLIEFLKTSKTRTRLERVRDAVLKGLRRLIGLPASSQLDMFSNIKWNVGAAIRLGRDGEVSPSLILHQKSRGGDSRLRRLADAFEAKIANHLRDRDPEYSKDTDMRIRQLANDALNRVTAGGFQLDAAQASTFRSIQAALATSMQFDQAALVRAQDLFTSVIQHLEFMSGREATEIEEGLAQETPDYQLALKRFRLITGDLGTETDAEGRSNLLATFIALSQVSPTFRETLRDMEVPKAPGINYDSVDDMLSSFGDRSMNQLSTLISDGRTKSSDMERAFDRLALVLSEIEKDARTEIERQAQSLMSRGDARGSAMLSKVGEKLTVFANENANREFGEERRSLRDNTRTILAGTARQVAALLTEDGGKAGVRTWSSVGNKAPDMIRPVVEIMNDVIGITDENRGIYEIINRVKYAISSVRQDNREELPRIITEQFSRDLSDHEWGAMFKAFGKTDIAVLREKMSLRHIRQILQDNGKLSAAIRNAEEEVQGFTNSKTVTKGIERKAKELAQFMVHGTIDGKNHNLLRNAYAVTNLLGEPEQKDAVVTEAGVQSVDRLITLYALQELDADTLSTVRSLAETEAAGVDFINAYLEDLRHKEVDRVQTKEAQVNGYKGYIPSEAREGAHLIVADAAEHSKLVSLGYTRMGDYRGSGLEGGKQSYYFTTVGSNAMFNQGAMQTVHSTSFGVDPRTGKTFSGNVAGSVEGTELAVIKRRIQKGQYRGKGEALMPVYGADGSVVAYERHMAPEFTEALQRSTHVGQMIGAWSGRHIEESLAESFNEILIDRIHDAWEKGKADDREDEFVDLSDKDLEDEVYKDAWQIIPQQTKDYISETFGDSGFMVRKDMINNAVGYRDISVGQAWTGSSRMSEPVKKAIRDVTETIMGRNAYRNMVVAEKAWQAGISVAKNTIVIRSVIVPASNIASNVVQLMVNGVNLRDIVNGSKTKLVEIDHHLKNLKRIVEIDAKLARHRNNPKEVRRLEAEKKSLQDASRRMSIWPLIEAGEFTTISEGLTEADAALSQGKYADYMNNLIDKLPAQLGTAGRYAMVTRDTALFQGMSRAVQYGDFIAKAILWDHMTKRQGISPEETMKTVTEEFVNYNLLPGQTRSYAESMGLSWFWAYKLRSLKVAHRHLRDHPLRALLSITGMPLLPEVPGVSIGSPITDNAASVIADGRAGYSLGTGMLFQAPALNPVVNIIN